MNAKAALPSLFTISSLFCGFLSMYYAVNERLLGAALLIVIAGFLDACDGKIARYFDTPSNFGVQFDTIVDVCSFGVAPAVLMLHYLDNLLAILWLPFAVCFLFLMCGALRLARFNTQLKGFDKENFSGLPIPMAAGTLAAYILFTQRVWQSGHEPHIAISLCVMLSFLMISTIEYNTLPRLSIERGRDRIRLIALLCVIVLMFFYTYEVFFPLALAFSLSGALRWLYFLITDREVADIRD
jgi:CDP-diacylglycerol--serine O-phosphatidyltransferase